ncbi:MoaD/ThiS family protein [Legionella sp. W05-934-2]|uniref:MoaD/ThiS family protein n=1 Tax=Legionella sp. W05-934-2 TaxID=1198649 RepID=UPI003461C47F
MRITVNEIGQQQRQHILETNQDKLLPFLQETNESQGLSWLYEGKLQAHIRVYINQQWIADPTNQPIHNNDVIDLISPMAGG